MNKNIILCGFMGSGKTTVGKGLAQALARPFVDVDEEIVRRAGMPVSALFDRDGEDAFRDLEHEVCRTLAKKDGLVIAPGGGALLQKRNEKIFKINGVILYLDTTLETIGQRLANDRTRPLLNGPGRDEEMKRLFYARKPGYMRISDGRISADGDPETVVSAILEWLDRHRGNEAL